MRNFRLAAAQFEPVSLDKEANFKTVTGFVEQAAQGGAEMVCFHEQCLVGYNMWGEKGPSPVLPDGDEGRKSPQWKIVGVLPADHAEPVPDGPYTKQLIELAAKHNVIIMAGIAELSHDDLCYNTTVVVGPKGYIGKYRKVHLVPGTERNYFRQGGSLPVFDLDFCKMGCLICYDNHFPEAHRVLALQGANLIVMPHVTVARSWWPDGNDEEAQKQARNWILTWCRARAFDNSAYVVFVNQATNSGDGPQGCSMVLNPDGHVISKADTTGNELIFADIDADYYHRVRHRTHDYLRHRRPELYKPLTDHLLGLDP